MANPKAKGDDIGTLIRVYIDTSLDTHLVMAVSEQDTIAECKRKIVAAHSSCFPNIGQISVNAIQVKRRGFFYSLLDSLCVKTAFGGVKGRLVLFVDACRLIEKGLEICVPVPRANGILRCLEHRALEEKDIGDISGVQVRKVLDDLEMEFEHVGDEHCKTSSDTNKRVEPEVQEQADANGEVDHVDRLNKKRKVDEFENQSGANVIYGESCEGNDGVKQNLKKRQKILEKEEAAASGDKVEMNSSVLDASHNGTQKDDTKQEVTVEMDNLISDVVDMQSESAQPSSNVESSDLLYSTGAEVPYKTAEKAKMGKKDSDRTVVIRKNVTPVLINEATLIEETELLPTSTDKEPQEEHKSDEPITPVLTNEATIMEETELLPTSIEKELREEHKSDEPITPAPVVEASKLLKSNGAEAPSKSVKKSKRRKKVSDKIVVAQAGATNKILVDNCQKVTPILTDEVKLMKDTELLLRSTEKEPRENQKSNEPITPTSVVKASELSKFVKESKMQKEGSDKTVVVSTGVNNEIPVDDGQKVPPYTNEASCPDLPEGLLKNQSNDGVDSGSTILEVPVDKILVEDEQPGRPDANDTLSIVPPKSAKKSKKGNKCSDGAVGRNGNINESSKVSQKGTPDANGAMCLDPSSNVLVSNLLRNGVDDGSSIPKVTMHETLMDGKWPDRPNVVSVSSVTSLPEASFDSTKSHSKRTNKKARDLDGRNLPSSLTVSSKSIEGKTAMENAEAQHAGAGASNNTSTGDINFSAYFVPNNNQHKVVNDDWVTVKNKPDEAQGVKKSTDIHDSNKKFQVLGSKDSLPRHQLDEVVLHSDTESFRVPKTKTPHSPSTSSKKKVKSSLKGTKPIGSNASEVGAISKPSDIETFRVPKSKAHNSPSTSSKKKSKSLQKGTMPSGSTESEVVALSKPQTPEAIPHSDTESFRVPKSKAPHSPSSSSSSKKKSKSSHQGTKPTVSNSTFVAQQQLKENVESSMESSKLPKKIAPQLASADGNQQVKSSHKGAKVVALGQLKEQAGAFSASNSTVTSTARGQHTKSQHVTVTKTSNAVDKKVLNNTTKKKETLLSISKFRDNYNSEEEEDDEDEYGVDSGPSCGSDSCDSSASELSATDTGFTTPRPVGKRRKIIEDEKKDMSMEATLDLLRSSTRFKKASETAERIQQSESQLEFVPDSQADL